MSGYFAGAQLRTPPTPKAKPASKASNTFTDKPLRNYVALSPLKYKLGRQLMELMTRSGKPRTAADFALPLGLSQEKVKPMLKNLVQAGHLRSEGLNGVMIYDLPERGA